MFSTCLTEEALRRGRPVFVELHLQNSRTASRQTWHKCRDSVLHVKKVLLASYIKHDDGRATSAKSRAAFACVGKNDWCYKVLRHCWKRGFLPTSDRWSVYSDRMQFSGPDYRQWLWGPWRSEQGVFMLISGPEAIRLSVCPTLYTTVWYAKTEKEMLAKLLRLGKVHILSYSIFSRLGYLQHGGSGLEGPCNQRH